MNRSRTRAAVLALVGPVALVVAPADTAAQLGRPAGDVTARVDSIFAEWNTPGSPGCAVGVSEAGRVAVTRAYGLAELEHGAPNSPSTIFEAGSVSKQFTAASILLLAQQGRLSLDDDIREHVPELPEYGVPVTVRHLIHHTSGLRDWGNVAAVSGWPRTTRAHTHDHVLEILSRQRSLNYPAGEEYSYTNSGYNLMAMIVERVSGIPFAEFSRREIFEPLGMHSTQWRDDFTRIVPGRATAYSPLEEGGYRENMPFENVHGNGGLLTTVGDLLTWNRNLETGEVGGRALVEAMHRRGRLNDGREISYASGLVVDTYRGVPEVSHGGATAGYRAFLTRFPEQDVSVAVLCNVTGLNSGALAHRTAEIFIGDALQPEERLEGVRLAPEVLATRAGMYRNLRTHEPVELEVRDGRLMVGGTPLVPLSDSEFSLGGGAGRLEVSSEDGGRAASLLLRTGDGSAVALERVEPASPSPVQLASYEGRYHSEDAGIAYSAEIVDGALRLAGPAGRVIPLQPAYADTFAAPSGWLVRFVRGADGEVREMSIGTSRMWDLRFDRGAR